MKIELNFTKKHLYFGVILLTLFAGIIFVKSYDPSQGWHPASQIDFSSGVNINSVQIQGTAGRNWFYDSESTTRRLRVGNAWGKSGIYAENGDLVIGGSSGNVRLYGNQNLEVGGDIQVSSDVTVGGNVIMGHEIKTSTGVGTATASCTPGKKVIGGTCNPPPGLSYSRPKTDGTGWQCGAISGDQSLEAYAICARVG